MTGNSLPPTPANPAPLGTRVAAQRRAGRGAFCRLCRRQSEPDMIPLHAAGRRLPGTGTGHGGRGLFPPILDPGRIPGAGGDGGCGPGLPESCRPKQIGIPRGRLSRLPCWTGGRRGPPRQSPAPTQPFNPPLTTAGFEARLG